MCLWNSLHDVPKDDFVSANRNGHFQFQLKMKGNKTMKMNSMRGVGPTATAAATASAAAAAAVAASSVSSIATESRSVAASSSKSGRSSRKSTSSTKKMQRVSLRSSSCNGPTGFRTGSASFFQKPLACHHHSYGDKANRAYFIGKGTGFSGGSTNIAKGIVTPIKQRHDGHDKLIVDTRKNLDHGQSHDRRLSIYLKQAFDEAKNEILMNGGNVEFPGEPLCTNQELSAEDKTFQSTEKNQLTFLGESSWTIWKQFIHESFQCARDGEEQQNMLLPKRKRKILIDNYAGLKKGNVERQHCQPLLNCRKKYHFSDVHSVYDQLQESDNDSFSPYIYADNCTFYSNNARKLNKRLNLQSSFANEISFSDATRESNIDEEGDGEQKQMSEYLEERKHRCEIPKQQGIAQKLPYSCKYPSVNIFYPDENHKKRIHDFTTMENFLHFSSAAHGHEASLLPSDVSHTNEGDCAGEAFESDGILDEEIDYGLFRIIGSTCDLLIEELLDGAVASAFARRRLNQYMLLPFLTYSKQKNETVNPCEQYTNEQLEDASNHSFPLVRPSIENTVIYVQTSDIRLCLFRIWGEFYLRRFQNSHRYFGMHERICRENLPNELKSYDATVPTSRVRQIESKFSSFDNFEHVSDLHDRKCLQAEVSPSAINDVKLSVEESLGNSFDLIRKCNGFAIEKDQQKGEAFPPEAYSCSRTENSKKNILPLIEYAKKIVSNSKRLGEYARQHNEFNEKKASIDLNSVFDTNDREKYTRHCLHVEKNESNDKEQCLHLEASSNG